MYSQTPRNNAAPALHSTLHLLPKLAKKEGKIFLKSLNQYFTLKYKEPQKKQSHPYTEGIWKQNMFLIFPLCFHYSFPADQQYTEGLVCWGILIWTCVKSECVLREIFRVSQKNVMTRATHTQQLQCQGRKGKWSIILYWSPTGHSFFAFLLTAQNSLCCESTENCNCQLM